VPVKPKPYQKLNLGWYGEKYKSRFAKPKELISATYENLCSCLWPVPLGDYKKKENVMSKQVEQFLGIDDLTTKYTIKDALKQLDEVCKVNVQEVDDSREVKLVGDMCFQLYEYIQNECQRRPAENIPVVREFFAERRCILLNEEFVCYTQLCWHLNVNLKSMYYQIPTTFLRSFKYLFNQVLNIKVNLDLPDLLHVVDTMKKKYKEAPITNKEDFSLLMNVYTLMIDQGYQIITNLHLPNMNGVLCPGRSLYFHPMSVELLDRPADDYVHPAVDRRICGIAGCTLNKKQQQQQDTLLTIQSQSGGGSSSSSNSSPNSSSTVGSGAGLSARIFPRVFGNKRLEGILSRLDDDRIDINYINNIDEGNPQIILDYLLEANRIHSLSAFLSDDDIFVIFKYFNDFLARNYQSGTFQRLKEIKIYKPLWSEKYINLSFTGTSIHPVSAQINANLATLSQFSASTQTSGFISLVPNVYLISEDMTALMKRSFKTNPFMSVASGVASPSSPITNGAAATGSSAPFIILQRRNELAKLYSHLSLLSLSDLDSFLHLCLPQFRRMEAKSQNNFLKYLYEEIMEKSFTHEKEKCFKLLKERLYLQTRRGDQRMIAELYDTKSESLKRILVNESYFPDECFDSPQCLRFLKDAGLRAYLPGELLKRCMNELEQSVSESGWTSELRTRSEWLYKHLCDNWQKYDESVLEHRFLEPHCPLKRLLSVREPFEYSEFAKSCLKLSDAELHKYEMLVWSSSYVLPEFVSIDKLSMDLLEFLKLDRKPCFALVNQHLTNICESIGKRYLLLNVVNVGNGGGEQQNAELIDEQLIVELLGRIYEYLDDEMSANVEHQKDMCKQLEEKEIVWSSTTRKFVAPSKICIALDAADEIAPFLYSLAPSLKTYKSLLIRLGAKERPYAMLYGDILRKMAKVCGDDYLNSNELCKALRAMECFFKHLKLSSSSSSSSSNAATAEPNIENITPQYKLPGLYFVTTELKLERSNTCVMLDNRDNLDDIGKLPQDKFVFNPSERVFKMSTTEIKPLIDKIFISQRPTLFSQKYEATYDYTLPDDPDSQRQNLLTSLERKYQQIFTSRQLHRCLARCISNEEARKSSPKHLPIDEVEKVIRERLSSIKVTCVEYLETSLSYRKLAQQQKIEQTVEEKACYLTHETTQFATLYVSKKHIEQPYFALCLARSLQPLLIDLHFDYSIFTSLIATSVSQMSKLLQLVNVATEENILSVIKLQYVPSSGKLYGDDINLLAAYDPKLHNVLIGDLCVYANPDGTYVYCQIVKIKANAANKPKYYSQRKHASTLGDSLNGNETGELSYEFVVQLDESGHVLQKISQKDLYVLENWHRIYDAIIAKPQDERESYKHQETNNSGKGSSYESGSDSTNGGNGRKTATDAGDENYSSNASDSDKSDTSSTYGSNENLPNSYELEQAKAELNQELRILWSLEENERKKKINRLLLKWHPDKNPGKEKYASEVFKHLKKQIELFKTDPYLAGLYRSTYSSYGFNSSSSANSAYGAGGMGSAGDDYKSRHYGSFDDLHRKGSPSGGSPHSSPSREGGGGGYGASTNAGFDYDMKGPGASNLGRTGSFRQEWERRRQQKRQTTGTDAS
jgi:hypothetical protein